MENLERLGNERCIWWERLNRRYERLTRLVEHGTPRLILMDEIKLIYEAEKMCKLLSYKE